MPSINVPTFVKWAGGKTQLLDQFASLFPEKIDRYFEPMVGGGAVFFYIKQWHNPDSCMISDINEDLMNLYSVVKDRVDDLIELLKMHKSKHMSAEVDEEKYYYKMRDKFNDATDILEKSALFLYLNKTCYNGLYRVNSKGEFNVPFGRYKKPAILQEKKLRKASKLLQGVDLAAMHYKNILDDVKQDDFIYLDPPYYPLSDTSNFTSYQKDVFLEDEQKELAEFFKNLDEKNCNVMLSNSDHPFIHGLYDEFDIEMVKARRMISCDAEGRGAINEVVVRNYDI